MSRAVRRQQAAAPKERPQRPVRGLGGSGRPPSRGAAPPARQRRRLFRVPSWLEEIVSELKKVTWPTRDEVIYLTTVVIIVSVAVGIVLGGVDIFFNWLIDQLLLQ
jgi:preprotein translocase subunit SecE